MKKSATKNQQTVTFDAISFTKAGTYNFTITETVPEGATGNKKDGITYDNTPKTITIVVKDNGNGALFVETPAAQLKVTASNTYGATDTSAAVTTDTSAAVSATKVFTGRDWTDADSFEFTLAADANNPEGATLPTTVTKSATKNRQTVTFDAISFTKAGTYNFTITETVPTDADGNDVYEGIKYDGTAKEITIEVEDDGKGKLVVKNEEDSLTVTASNTYSAEGEIVLKAHKVLNGRELKAEEFTFELKDADGTVLQTKTNDAKGIVTFDPIGYTLDDLTNGAGEKTYTISEVKGEDKTVAYDPTVIDIKVTLTDLGNGTIEAVAEPEEAEIVFTNNTYHVHVSKVDVGDHSKELEGAHIQILDENGKVVEECGRRPEDGRGVHAARDCGAGRIHGYERYHLHHR